LKKKEKEKEIKINLKRVFNLIRITTITTTLYNIHQTKRTAFVIDG
jgi:hypothetical protein